jgi:hypothetical protein
LSGRRGGRRCTDDLWRLDIRPLIREGRFVPGTEFQLTWGPASSPAARVVVHCKATWTVLESSWPEGAGWRTISFEVGLTSTPCHFGGSRWWWVCPGCRRRVAVLYGRGRFGCQECLQLAYRSQRETERARVLRRANAMRRLFGWPPGVIHGHGDKPKHLHGSTYRRMLRRYDADVHAFFVYMSQSLRAVEANLADIQARRQQSCK